MAHFLSMIRTVNYNHRSFIRLTTALFVQDICSLSSLPWNIGRLVTMYRQVDKQLQQQKEIFNSLYLKYVFVDGVLGIQTQNRREEGAGNDAM